MKKEFEVVCKNCGKKFFVVEEENKFPIKEKYFCSRSCANTRYHSIETKQKISNGVKNSEKFKDSVSLMCLHKFHNKFYSRVDIKDNKVLRYHKCKQCGKEFEISEIRDIKGRNFCSNKCKHLYLSNITGGYRVGSGIGKHGKYKGIRCDSTWELAFLIYYLEHNLYIKRCTEKRSYVFNNKVHAYYPDFVTEDGIIEIKGYITEQSKAKHEQNPDIKILTKVDLVHIFNYVYTKYGKDIVKLYD